MKSSTQIQSDDLIPFFNRERINWCSKLRPCVIHKDTDWSLRCDDFSEGGFNRLRSGQIGSNVYGLEDARLRRRQRLLDQSPQVHQSHSEFPDYNRLQGRGDIAILKGRFAGVLPVTSASCVIVFLRILPVYLFQTNDRARALSTMCAMRQILPRECVFKFPQTLVKQETNSTIFNQLRMTYCRLATLPIAFDGLAGRPPV